MKKKVKKYDKDGGKGVQSNSALAKSLFRLARRLFNVIYKGSHSENDWKKSTEAMYETTMSWAIELLNKVGITVPEPSKPS